MPTTPANELDRLAAPRFVWTVDGEPHAGELERYAKDLEHAAYVDVEVGPLTRLVDGELVEVEVERGGYESADYLVVDLAVAIPGHLTAEARYRIDLRV